MKIIITTVHYNDLKNKLMLCKSFDEIQNTLLSVGYFSFFEVKSKQKKDMLKLYEELSFYRELRQLHPEFPKKINVYTMHNEFFYEEEGISKLDNWNFFRNVFSNFSLIINPDIEFPNCIKNVVEAIKLNNFSKQDFLAVKAEII